MKAAGLDFFFVRPGSAHRVINSRLGCCAASFAQPHRRATVLHSAPQPEQRLLLVAGVFGRQPGQRVGHDIAVVQVLHLGITAEVQPKPVDQLRVIRPQGGRMGANVERLRLAIGETT